MASTSAPASDSAPADAPAASRKVRTIVISLILVCVAITAGIFGVRKVHYSRAHESTDNAQVDGHIVPVLAKVGAYITDVKVAENDSVHAGATLIELDDTELRVRLMQADAELAAAQAAAGDGSTPGQAAAQVAGATSQGSAVQAQIESARIAARTAQADVDRIRDLAAKHIVSKQQLDAAESAALMAQSQLQAVERQAGSADAALAGAVAGVRLADARLKSARAARENAALQLSYAHVVAPAAGRIARKQAEIGQLVQPGQPLLSIVADSGIWVTANFKETQVGDIRPGMAAEMTVDAYPGCKIQGRVDGLSAATGAKFSLLPPDNSTGNFTKVVQRIPVRVLVLSGCGEGRPLRPGMSVGAAILTR